MKPIIMYAILVVGTLVLAVALMFGVSFVMPGLFIGNVPPEQNQIVVRDTTKQAAHSAIQGEGQTSGARVAPDNDSSHAVKLYKDSLRAVTGELEQEKLKIQELNRTIEARLKEQLAQGGTREQDAKEKAKLLESMSAEEAAKILATMDEKEARAVLMLIKKRQAGKILSALEPEIAAKIMR